MLGEYDWVKFARKSFQFDRLDWLNVFFESLWGELPREWSRVFVAKLAVLAAIFNRFDFVKLLYDNEALIGLVFEDNELELWGSVLLKSVESNEVRIIGDDFARMMEVFLDRDSMFFTLAELMPLIEFSWHQLICFGILEKAPVKDVPDEVDLDLLKIIRALNSTLYINEAKIEYVIFFLRKAGVDWIVFSTEILIGNLGKLWDMGLDIDETGFYWDPRIFRPFKSPLQKLVTLLLNKKHRYQLNTQAYLEVVMQYSSGDIGFKVARKVIRLLPVVRPPLEEVAGYLLYYSIEIGNNRIIPNIDDSLLDFFIEEVIKPPYCFDRTSPFNLVQRLVKDCLKIAKTGKIETRQVWGLGKELLLSTPRS